MENNERTPRDNPSGQNNSGSEKSYHKHNRRRGHNRPRQTENDASGINVRPGRYDVPPSNAQKQTVTVNDAKAPTGENPPAQSNSEHRRRRSRGGKRHHRDRKPIANETALNESLEAILGEGSAALSKNEYSEYVTTAGSLEPEIIEELNSITEEDAKRIENDEYIPEATPSEPEIELAKYNVVGIRFKVGGKIYYFDPKDFEVKKGESVIVETSRGLELGVCELPCRTVTEREVVLPLRTVVRIATNDDMARHEANVKYEKEAFETCTQKIAEHKLGMKLIDVEYAFDGSKLLFYFTAEGRVDFRELVKDLASVFRTRIELRQIGIRDETKLLGGIGICGRPFCCKSFLSDFVQVSIKMAKEQNLSLNSAKISGACGRLMCCLRYEYDVYQEEIKKTPRVDQIVATPDGDGTVIEVQPLAGLVRVRFGTKAEMIPPKVYHRDDVKVIGGKGVKPKEDESDN